MAELHLMKTQLKLELNMKKTLLARVVMALAATGVASSVCYGATDATVSHTVIADHEWELTIVNENETRAGLITDNTVGYRGQDWGDIRVVYHGTGAFGALTNDTPDDTISKGFLWTHTDNSTIKGFVHNEALQSESLNTGVKVTRDSSGQNMMQDGDQITIKLGAASNQSPKPGVYTTTFHLKTWEQY